MYNAPYHGPFSLLPERRPPWKEFIFSFSSQGLGLFLLAWLAVLHPEVLVPPTHDYHFIRLVETPAPVNHQPQPPRALKQELARLETLTEPVLRLPPEVKPRLQHDESPQAPKIELASNKAPMIPPAAPVIPRQPVKTNVFSTGSSEPATIAKAPEKVQTGGFGDPNGVPARENHGRPINIAQSGSYDLPSGPGYGNGTGGANGARGVVASAGFGNGVAIVDGHAIAKACACDNASCAVCTSSTVTIARARGQVVRSRLRDVDGPSMILAGRHAVGIAESSGLHFLRSFGDGRRFRAAGREYIRFYWLAGDYRSSRGNHRRLVRGQLNLRRLR